MPNVAQFTNNLGLDKADESSLLQHVQECHLQGRASLMTDAQNLLGGSHDFLVL